MSWLEKIASEEARRARNIERLVDLQKAVHDLAWFATASQSGGYTVLEGMLDNRLVLGRPRVHDKLKEALIGENNQKIALDAPTRFQRLLLEAEDLVKVEIGKENRELRKLVNG